MSAFAKAYRDALLTNVSIAYMNDAKDYVGKFIAPFVKVEKDSWEIFNYGKQSMRIVNDEKSIGGSYNKVRYSVERAQHYFLKDYGLIGEVFEEDVDNAETPLNAETDTTELLTAQFLLNMEKRIAGVINTTNITQNVTLSGTSRWSDYSGTSDPIANIQTAINTIHANTGKYANSILLSFDTVIALKNHPKILARYQNNAVITDQMVKDSLGAILGIQNVYFGNAREITDNSPVATPMSLIWSNIALVFYAETTPTLKSVSFMKTYAKRDGHEVTKLGQDKLASEALERKVYSKVRVAHKYDQVVVDAKAAYLIVGTTA